MSVMHRIRKIWKRMLIIALSAGLLTGCGIERGVSEQLEDMVNEETSGISVDEGTDLGFNIPKEPVNQLVSNEDGTTRLNVSYTVREPKLDRMALPVYRMKLQDRTESYFDTLARKIFDDGTYEVIKPAVWRTSEELAAEETYLLNEVRASEQMHTGASTLYEGRIIAQEFGEIQDCLSGEKTTAENLSNSNMIFSLQDDTESYCKMLLLGRINGSYYFMYYMEGTYNLGNYPFDYFGIERAYTPWIVTSSRYSLDSTVSSSLYPDGNQSDVETCYAIAEEVLKKLGREDLILLNTYETMVEQSDHSLDGYHFEFVPGTEQVKGMLSWNNTGYQNPRNQEELVPLSTINALFMDEERGFDSKRSAVQEGIRIICSGNELTSIRFYGGYYEYECIEESARLLSFDKIQQSLQSFAQRTVDCWPKWSVSLPSFKGKDAELRYAAVKYEEEYRLVPAWFFYWDYGDSERDEIWVAINALDGSVIEYICTSY